MSGAEGHGRLAPTVANDERTTSSAPPAPLQRALLPRSVERKFTGPRVRRMFGRDVPCGEVFDNERDEMNAAAWCALLGWSAADVVEYVSHLAASRGIEMSEGSDRPWAQGSWPDSWEHWADDFLALGSYLVHGVVPSMVLREDQITRLTDKRTGEEVVIPWPSTAQRAARGDWAAPTGVPKLSRDDLCEYLDEVLAAAWPFLVGRSRHSDRAVLQAAVSIARAAGTVVPDLSVRRISREANVSEQTTVRSVKRLRDYGILRPFGDRAVGCAQSYVLAGPSLRFTTHQIPVTRPGLLEDLMCGDLETPLSHPAFHGPSGKVRRSLLEALAAGPMKSDRDWYTAALIPKPTFYRRRPILTGQVEGVPPAVQHGPDGWRLVEPERLAEALDAIAEHEGLTDKVETRSQRLRREQEQYANFLLRNVPDTHQAHSPGRAVDVRTGEVVAINEVVDMAGRPLPAVTSNVVPATSPALGVDVVLEPLEPPSVCQAAQIPVRASAHVSKPQTGLCVSCGLPAEADETTGLRLHGYCRAPHWMAPMYERLGQPIPSHQILPKPTAPPPDFDPYEIDPVEHHHVHPAIAGHAA